VIACGKAEILAEKRQHVILEAISDSAGVCAGVDFEAVYDAVVIENGMEFAGIDAQTVLIAYIHSNGAILLKIADVLINKGER
jgi:hypothetical protein